MSSLLTRGIKGEKEVCNLLRVLGLPVSRNDGYIWLKGKLTFIEIKNHELFTPPPFWGQGLDKEQFDKYMKIYNENNIRTILFVRDFKMDWLWNFLDKLEKDFFITKTGEIIIFPIVNFQPIHTLKEVF